MFWNLVISSTSGLIVDKILEKNIEKANSSLNIWQRQREKNKFSKVYYENILRKYGNSPYYDSMLSFILRKNLIEAIFENHSSLMSKTKGDQNLISYYIEIYKKENNNSVEHTSFAKKILYDLYYAILDFNLSSKYISSEKKMLSNQNLNSQNIMDSIQKTGDIIKDEITHLRKYSIQDNQTKDDSYYIDEDKLNDYKIKLLKEFKSEYYLPRKIESLNGLKTYNDSFQLLKKKKKITITGEAGIGKSTEAKSIFITFINDETFQNHIPVYLNLAHYGVLYNNLKEGIKQTLNEFIQFNKDTLDTILSDETMIIIFDGLDEINDDSRIDKAIAELNSLSFKFNDNYYLITIRENQIQNRISEEIVYRLLPFDYSQLTMILDKNSMIIDFDYDYTEILKNPLFLKLAVNLYTKNNQYVKLNKSDLIEAIILDLLTNLSLKFSTSKTLDLLADFSYDFFSQNSFTHLDFEEYFEYKIADSNTSRFIINNLIQSNIFKVNEFTIEFTYKTFKDYFCSRFLLNQSKEKENLEFLKDYIDKNEWEDSLIYLVGLFNNLDEQTNLLNVYMKFNLKLYVKSVESKNNLYEELKKLSLKKYIEKLGIDFLETYEYLIKRYFSGIGSLIYPFSSLRENKNMMNYHRSLVMHITEDKKQLSYFLRLVPISEDKLQLVTDIGEFQEIYSNFHNDFSIQTLIKTHSKDLHRNYMSGDSGRLLAVKQLKSELSELIENQSLIDTSYIYFENLKALINKVDFVRKLDSIDDIINKLEKYLVTFNDDSLGINIFDTKLILGYTQIDLVDLYKSLIPLKNKNISFSDFSFIERDMDYSKSNGYVWSFYSIDNRKEIIRKFFEVGNLSVHQMFSNNFPELTDYLVGANSVPYRTDVYIERELKIEENTLLTYVDVPVEKKEQIKTRIHEVKQEQRNFNFILEKYSNYSLEKRPSRVSSTSFTHIFLSGKSYNNTPMTDYVYEEIKSRLETILGKLK